MKRSIILAVTLCLVSGVSAQTQYEQKEFIFTIPEDGLIERGVHEECFKALNKVGRNSEVFNINPTFAARYRTSTVEIRNGSGRVTDNDIGDTGEILECVDFQTYWPERNLLPAYFEVTLGGKTYRAVGAGTSPNFPELETLPGGGNLMLPIGFPEESIAPVHFSATVGPAIEGRVGGMLSIGFWNPFDGMERPNIDFYGIGVLQVMLPVKGNKEWLQLDESYTAEQVAAVCPQPSGICSGSLPDSNFDLTGYHWALPAEVDELFNSYGTSKKQFFDDYDAGDDKGELLQYGLARAPVDDEYIAYITAASYSLSDQVAEMNSTALGIDPESGSTHPPAGPWFWRPKDSSAKR